MRQSIQPLAVAVAFLTIASSFQPITLAGDAPPTTYTIAEENYKGLRVFVLDGGMSAEFAVEKAGEALAGGVSHSWYTSHPGSGPRPVAPLPTFLADSVRTTVDFYNTSFGAKTPFDTVIFSTGVACVPYQSRVMKVPVLPLHFLAGVETIKQLGTIVDRANADGLPAYATIGNDGSVGPAVAWVKLLDCPPAYRQFLIDHHVKNVVILGSTGTVGECKARKIIRPDTPLPGYEAGDIFLVYPGGAVPQEIEQLNRKLPDLRSTVLEPNYRQISDWESGVIREQVDRFAVSIRHANAEIVVDWVSTKGMDELYELATYLTLAFYKKNEVRLTADHGLIVRGIVLNPYLLSHPFYETKIRYVPFLFWQGNPAGPEIDVRLNVKIRKAVAAYFPDIRFDDLAFWIDFSNNFGGAPAAATFRERLIHIGLHHIETQDYLVDEVWNPRDGMNSPCEVIAQRMTTFSTAAELKKWDADLQPLTLTDLEAMPTTFAPLSVVRQR